MRMIIIYGAHTTLPASTHALGKESTCKYLTGLLDCIVLNTARPPPPLTSLELHGMPSPLALVLLLCLGLLCLPVGGCGGLDLSR